MQPAWRVNAEGEPLTGSSGAQAASWLAATQLEARPPQQPARTSGDFAREWRRSCPNPSAKYEYLMLCAAAGQLANIFRVEVSSLMLGDMLQALDTCWLAAAGEAKPQCAAPPALCCAVHGTQLWGLHGWV